MKLLFLCLEPSKYYPEHSKAATELIPFLETQLKSDFEASEIVFFRLPYLYEEAVDSALAELEKQQPDIVFLLTNDPNHTDIVLHRYASHLYDGTFPDNQDLGGLIIPDGAPTFIAKTEVFKMHQLWQENQQNGYTHVTMTLAGSRGVESEVFYKLCEKYDKTDLKITQFGLPPIVPDHEGLRPEVLVRTLSMLIGVDVNS